MTKPHELFDALSELVYVSDVETYDLLYVNEQAASVIDRPWQGRKCYEAIQGKTEPCSFCTNEKLTHDEFYTWNFHNEQYDRYYALKDKLINWEDRSARIEIAFDMTDALAQQAALEKQLDFEKLLVECMMTLHQSDGLEGDMEPMFSKIGEYFKADRVYIFQVTKGNIMNNTHEWCAEGISPEIDNLQGYPLDFISHWLPYFEKRDSYILYDIEEKKDEPDYEVLKPQGIESLVAAPLYAGNRLIGYMGIDNPAPEILENSASFFKSLGLFLSMEIEKNMTKEELRLLSFVDSLTGLGNRNSYIQFIAEHDRKGPKAGYGIMYVDLNGLKNINDNEGHAQGDLALRKTAEALVEAFPSAHVYRLGGDEFLVVATEVEEADFCSRAEKAKLLFGANGYSMAAGIYYADKPILMDEAVRSADSRMYDDKRDFYRDNSEESRHSAVFAVTPSQN